jgi:diguanylate cyclase (GGDEF)-like protein/PAS domain S-box-containing protein
VKRPDHKQVEGPVHPIETALRHANDAVVITTMDLNPPGPQIVYVNEAFCRMTGYAAEEIVGKTPRILQGPKTSRTELVRLRRLLSRGEPFEGELINYRKDGSEYLLEWHIAPLRDEAGEITHWVASQRDVTEHRRAQKALKESEARYRTVVGNAPVVLFALDEEGVFTLSEGKGLKALGLEPGEVVGRSVFEVYRNVPGILEHAQRALGGEEISATEKVGPLAFEAFYAPLRAEDGGILGVIGVAADVTERERARERLRHQALHDPLTDLPNRTLFMDRLEHALATLEWSEGDAVAVLFVDLDDFKVVNDSLGHEVGDALLVAVAERLRVALKEDTVARFGGDEFAILLESIIGPSDATHLARRIIEELRKPFVVEGREVYTSPSIGIVSAASSHDRPKDLLRKADLAMYAAKAKGKACYEAFDPAMSVRATERLEVENDLRRVIERGEIRAHYQPKVLLRTGEIVGTETLMRWEHPERGLLPPAAFISIAEKTDLIVPLGRWVLAEACRQTRGWQDLYSSGPPLGVSVNVSGRQLRHPELVKDVGRVLQETGLEPGSLGLEITESVLVEDELSTLATLRELKCLGIKLMIDDFGTGYSSLSYLKRLPADFLKIDRSFIERLGEDPKDEGIVSAVIELARVLGMEAIAEGVENAEQAAHLRELGCHFAQGNLFSKPLPAEGVGALLATGLAD